MLPEQCRAKPPHLGRARRPCGRVSSSSGPASVDCGWQRRSLTLPSKWSSSTAKTITVPAPALSSGDGRLVPGRHRRADPQHRRHLPKHHRHARRGQRRRRRGARGLERAFAQFAESRVAAVVVGNDASFLSQRAHIIALARRHSLPEIYEWREFAAAGGLMSYGPSLPGMFRQLGVYAARILDGARVE